MLEAINDFFLSLADPLLGGLLHVPRDVALIVVAVGTALILTLVRLVTTDQELLGRCDHDKKRLKERIKAIKRQDEHKTAHEQIERVRDDLTRQGHDVDPEDADKLEKVLTRALTRADLQGLRSTKNAVGLKTLRQELLPLLVSLPLIILIATWAFARLGYHAPPAAEPVEITMYLPRSAAGSLIHMVPQEGLSASEGWVREVKVETDMGQTYGVARWEVSGAASEDPYPLQVKHRSESYEHGLLLGQEKYAAPLKFFDDRGEYVLEADLKPYKPFGVIPSIPFLPFAPWLVGYLVIVIPFVPLLKRVTGIH